MNRVDWVKIIDEEREKYGLLESDKTIAQMSQEKYRNLVKKKVFTHAVDYLHALPALIQNQKTSKIKCSKDKHTSQTENTAKIKDKNVRM